MSDADDKDNATDAPEATAPEPTGPEPAIQVPEQAASDPVTVDEPAVDETTGRPSGPSFLARHGTALIIGVLAVALAVVTAVAGALWARNTEQVEELAKPRPTVKLGLPIVNPATSTTSPTTTTLRSSTSPSSLPTDSTTPTTSISVPGPTTSSAPRPATPDEAYELTNVAKAYYTALGAKNLDVLNALSCVKVTKEDIQDLPDDLKLVVDKMEDTYIDGDTAKSAITVTATSGGKTETKQVKGGFLQVNGRWVTCDNP